MNTLDSASDGSNPLSGLRYDDLARSSRARGLDRLSDHDLIAAAADVVATPRDAEFDSFVLHAPLELMARARLLPMVAPEHRANARLRIASVAAHYETFGEPLPDRAAAPSTRDPDPGATLIARIDAGDLDGTDAAAIELQQHPATAYALAKQLGPHLVRRTSAAAHAPIFFSLALRSDLAGVTIVRLLRPLVRELAREPDLRLRWLDDEQLDASPTDSSALAVALANAPHVGINGSTFVHPTMTQVDETGLACEHLGDILGASTTDAVHQLMRVAALSMLQDDPEHAKYGWTHTLTIPQAVLDLGDVGDQSEALAIAATQVFGFRCALGATNIRLEEPASTTVADDGAGRWPSLASRAATSHDAHIAKYALAVYDAARSDAAHAADYVRAGEHLLEVWSRTGDPTDPIG